MGETLKAEWFDLDDTDQAETIDWLHGTHLPAVQASAGVGWVGHYAIVDIPQRGFIKGAPERVETTDPSVPNGRQNVVLTAGLSAEVFFGQSNALDS